MTQPLLKYTQDPRVTKPTFAQPGSSLGAVVFSRTVSVRNNDRLGQMQSPVSAMRPARPEPCGAA